MPKFIYCMLLVMLCLVLIFSAFSIPYSQNNFFGMVLTLEHNLGNFSNWVLDTFSSVKNFSLKLFNYFDSLFENVIFKWFDSLNDRWNIVERIEKIGSEIEYFLFSGVSRFEFYGLYGFNVTDYKWQEKFHLFSSIWKHYKTSGENMFIDSSGSFNFDEFDKYYDCMKNGVDNEYSYLKTEMLLYFDRLYRKASEYRSLLYFGRSFYDVSSSYEADGYYYVSIYNIDYEFNPEEFSIVPYYTFFKGALYNAMLVSYEYPISFTSITYEQIPGEVLKPIAIRFVQHNDLAYNERFCRFDYYDYSYSIQFKFYTDNREFWVDAYKVINKLWLSSVPDEYASVYENSLVYARAFSSARDPIG